MQWGEIEQLRTELAQFVTEMFASVRRSDQRRWGECYLRGLMTDGRRKSIQPMAQRLPDGDMQALQQFVNQSPWDHTPVQQRIAQRMVPQIDPQVWVIDDVAFPKWGASSVGVAHQYCGALGKQANCQVATSVHAATDEASCPLSWRLFLPPEWAADRARCQAAGVPEQIGHVEKWRLALEILDQLAGWELAAPVVVADCGYGQIVPFRLGLEARGLTYVVGVPGKESAHPATAVPHRPVYGGLGPPTLPRYRTRPQALATLAAAGGRTVFTQVTWRQGSKGSLSSHFRLLRVRPAGKQARQAAAQAAGGPRSWDGVLPERMLLVEWPEGQDEPTDYWICNLPWGTPIEDVVRLAKMRWRVEHDYRELKHGLGLDHFEGRSWRGWHHHVTLVTAAHAFVTKQRLAPKAATSV
jgi:SRSO17 transposase